MGYTYFSKKKKEKERTWRLFSNLKEFRLREDLADDEIKGIFIEIKPKHPKRFIVANPLYHLNTFYRF